MGFNEEKDFQDFKKDMTQIQPNMEDIIKWYTKQTFVYNLMNALLRVMEHPGDIYSLQPFFKKLFLAIKKLHKKSSQESFVCYRGGLISQTEL